MYPVENAINSCQAPTRCDVMCGVHANQACTGGERGNHGASAVLLLYVAWALTYAATTPLYAKLIAYAFDHDDPTNV